MSEHAQCLKDFFWAFARCFWSRDFATMAEMHTLPLVIYSKVGAHVCRSNEELQVYLAKYRDLFDDRGVTHLTPRIGNIEDISPGRARVYIDWLSDNNAETVTSVFYYFVRTDGGWKIEMSRFERSATSPETISRVLNTKEVKQ